MKTSNRNKIIGIILVIIGVSIVFEMVQNKVSLILFLLGIIGITALPQIIPSKSRSITIISIILIGIALFSTLSAWVFTIILIITLFSLNQDLFQSIKQALFESNYSKVGSEFISIRLNNFKEKPAKRTRRQWFGHDVDEDTIYEWDDINYTKVLGDSVIDVGNTIIPKDQNIILIRKGIGNTKILIPEEVAVSLNLSVFLGRVRIGEDELALNNETITFRSDRYEQASRQLKIVSNVLVGDIEVIFLWVANFDGLFLPLPWLP